ncbi:Uncharacterized membrane protein [Sphingomonas sp. NFR04]|uniref:DUF2254 domain-containing protein n=1 Tax=Sphingomonas sp. NFR04 TaxID=1566283 RepID=UPI0008EF82C3|nr:DUF2254 domain-containing protein [Sphingomonas sp. NFR04]SFJ00187.1 Uncharacterized membrane protein [Sphingomonas sp. NFR04]
MKAALIRLADQLRQSYWFIPALMTFAAVLLAGGMVWLDGQDGSGWMDRFAWLHASRPSGARQLLSAIGGSMITVAGTVFSVTIAAVVYASGEYGPRLLSNFMRDRGNQITLGTFIATFLYCIIVLRTVRSPEESGAAAFVPNLAVLVALLLAICSVGVLIFFIHHVPQRIHINSVIEDIGRRLLREIDRRFPSFIGDAVTEDATGTDDARPPCGDACTVPARGTGYVQLIDEDLLMRLSQERDLVCRVRYQPGDFVHAGRPLLELWPSSSCDKDCVRQLQGAFALGAQRTALQDLRFLIDELVEIADRALSPGINDPFTAVTCMDWLGAALTELCRRKLPKPSRRDEAGTVRVIAPPLNFAALLDRSFGALLQHAGTSTIAALHYLQTLGEIAADCDNADRRALLVQWVERMERRAGDVLADHDARRVSEAASALSRSLVNDDE